MKRQGGRATQVSRRAPGAHARRPAQAHALFSVRTAAKRSTGLEEERKSCSTVTAGASSRLVTSRMLQIARAASKITTSLLWRRQDSRKS